MSENSDMLEVIKRHLGRPDEIELENIDGTKDKFKLSQIPVDNLPELYEILGYFANANEDKVSFFKNLNKESLNKISDVIVLSLKPNYPDIPEDLLRELSMRHALQIIMLIFKINMGVNTKDTDKLEKLKGLRKQINDK